MCGIVGLIRKSEVIDKNKIIRSLNSIAHRGPDDCGLFIHKNVGLGHRRLSIIDLTEQGHQPMHYDDLVIVYNGEIYNYLDLKNELIALGHTFITKTDTEVILHSYKQWGADCLDKFVGMWAFAILDTNENKIFCARDIFGIKPFYFYSDDSAIFFASEIKAILTFGIEPKVNYPIMMDYIVSGISDHTAKTFYMNINQLLPGHYMQVDLDNLNFVTKKYFNIASLDNKNYTCKDFELAIYNSIKLHLRSDVPVGTCLSGGLDSSTVATIASAYYMSQPKMKFSAVTAESESEYNSEVQYAKKVVDSNNLKWFIAKPTYKDFKTNIEECLRMQEEPVGSPSVFMQYWVMKTAKEAGLKVMLDGQGGDELLLGYERYYIPYFLYLLKRCKFISLFKEFMLASKNSKLSVARLILYCFYFSVPTVRWVRTRIKFSFIKTNYVCLSKKNIYKIGRNFWNLRKTQISEISCSTLPHLLRYEDRNSMAHSIEARVPFLEKNVLASCLSLKPENKIKNGYTKYALRLVADKILPKEISWRRNKLGFEAPSSLWLNKHKNIIQANINNSTILKNICRAKPVIYKLDENTRWRLYNIAVWEKLYNVKA